MEDAGDSAQPDLEGKKPSDSWWVRFISYVKNRTTHERRTKKQKESPVDRAARRTAAATIWMAVFTVILTLVSGGTLLILKRQLKEMQDGGTDTHKLAQAAGDQATWTQRLAGSADTQSGYMKDQAGRTKDLADRMKDQADRTKTMADQAIIQAKEAKVSAEAAESAAQTAVASIRPWIKITSVDLRPGILDTKTLMFHWPASGLAEFPQFAGKQLPPMLQIKVSMTNLGHSPAKDVEVQAELFFHRFDSGEWHKDVTNEQSRFCASVSKRVPSSAAKIGFPLDPLETSMGLSGIVKDADITNENGVRYSSAALLFCVNYRGSEDIPYQTQAWFGLYENNQIAIPIGVDVDSDRLRLIREENGDKAR